MAKLETLPRRCRECDVKAMCNGGCPKDRILRTPDGEAGLNYLCAAYKRFFSHVDPYMKFMAAELAQERPPAAVMAWAMDRDSLAGRAAKTGRNDPCPCGSGRKYKKCCGSGLLT